MVTWSADIALIYGLNIHKQKSLREEADSDKKTRRTGLDVEVAAAKIGSI